MGKLYACILKIFKRNSSTNETNFFVLTYLLFKKSDYKGCNFQNIGEESMALFTNCARTDCKYTYPAPSYATIMNAKPDTNSWYIDFKKFDESYAWKSKIRKAVWRGSLSEDDPSLVLESIRWRLVKKVHDLNLELFDVGFFNIPESMTRQLQIDASTVGGLKSKITPMDNLQRYMAIIDMDGNSWSSSFSTLLCYNSVVVKVEPTYVDYYYYDLKPWKHFIPVKADLSDLAENVAFVMNPKNEIVIKEIISSANQFCAERFVATQLVHDMLDIWEHYVKALSAEDPNWTQHWTEKKTTILSSKLYDLVDIDSLIN